MSPQRETHTRKTKINQKKSGKSTYSSREIDRSDLKISPEDHTGVFGLQRDDHIVRIHREKEEGSKELVIREMNTLKIIKLIYETSIILKHFIITIIEFHYFKHSYSKIFFLGGFKNISLINSCIMIFKI